MEHTIEDWHTKYIAVRLNDGLVEKRKQKNFKAEGITAVWGKEPFSDDKKQKLIKVLYPKDKYTIEYIKEHVLPQYDQCTNCTIGKEPPTKMESLKKGVQDIKSSPRNIAIIASAAIGIPALALAINYFRKTNNEQGSQ